MGNQLSKLLTASSCSSFLPCLVGLSLPQADITKLERTRLVPSEAIASYNSRKNMLIHSAVDIIGFGSSVGGGKPLRSGGGGCKRRQQAIELQPSITHSKTSPVFAGRSEKKNATNKRIRQPSQVVLGSCQVVFCLGFFPPQKQYI